MITILKSKIHRATVTETSLAYDGSITIDAKLMDAADILPYERVAVLNVNNGERFETYAIEGSDGEICLNGACARLAIKGDIVIILSYEITDHHKGVKIVNVDSNNNIGAVLSILAPNKFQDSECSSRQHPRPN